jgi:hypothetical protein
MRDRRERTWQRTGRLSGQSTKSAPDFKKRPKIKTPLSTQN